MISKDCDVIENEREDELFLYLPTVLYKKLYFSSRNRFLSRKFPPHIQFYVICFQNKFQGALKLTDFVGIFFQVRWNVINDGRRIKNFYNMENMILHGGYTLDCRVIRIWKMEKIYSIYFWYLFWSYTFVYLIYILSILQETIRELKR